MIDKRREGIGLLLLLILLLLYPYIPLPEKIKGVLIPGALIYIPIFLDRKLTFRELGIFLPSLQGWIFFLSSSLLIFPPFYGVTRYFLGMEWEGVPRPLFLFVEEILYRSFPEEIFFRGWLQKRIEEREPAFLLPTLSRGNFLVSFLFSLYHLPFDPSPHRLLVFFPSLWFGWLRTNNGGVFLPTLAHALSNFLLHYAMGG